MLAAPASSKDDGAAMTPVDPTPEPLDVVRAALADLDRRIVEALLPRTALPLAGTDRERLGAALGEQGLTLDPEVIPPEGGLPDLSDSVLEGYFEQVLPRLCSAGARPSDGRGDAGPDARVERDREALHVLSRRIHSGCVLGKAMLS